MIAKRTDLALEAHEIWKESAESTTQLSGVLADDYSKNGCKITNVKILDDCGSQALGKPPGNYITVELTGTSRNDEASFVNPVLSISDELRGLLNLDDYSTALIIGLGNWNITPDCIGPKSLESIMVTRHLVERMPEMFGSLRGVSALAPGVLGTTGLESAEIIRGVAARTNPSCIIAIDALASRKLSRLCNTVQIADTGIVPGSGVGNSRAAINFDELGIPVIAIGVPTVVDAATLASDITESAGIGDISPELLQPHGGSLMVTPRDIDSKVSEISKIIGYSVNLALHKDLSIEAITGYLS